ncbi:MAG: SAF domain-containing protein [Actinomycetota bacterium]|nr:SAF domain-containing protein [Actinomycetota bacterium]
MTLSKENAARRFVLTHRRVFAAGFAGLAVLFALAALKPSTPGSPVVVARHDLASGAVLTAGDLRTTTLPPGSKPSHSWSSPDKLLGRRISAPMREGEILTDYRLLEPGLLDGYGKGLVLATIHIAEPTQIAALRVGDHVNVVGSDPEGEAESTVIARRAVIASLPRMEGNDSSVAVALVVPESVGLKLATAGLRARMSVLSVP